MNNTDNFDRIEQFLFDELSAEEKHQFEEELKKNPALAEEVALHKLEHKVLYAFSDNDLLSEMANWKIQGEEPKVVPIQNKVQRLPLYRWSAAASIALLLGFTAWYVFHINPSAENIALSYFNEDVENVVDRGKQATPEETLLQAQTFIAEGKITEAFTQLSSIKEGDADYIFAQFLLGVIYFKQKEYSKAKLTFETTKKLSDPSLNVFSKKAIVQSSDWYEVLARLALNSKDPQISGLLNSIANNPDHNHNLLAKQLQADLKKSFRTKNILNDKQ